jgi:hypothetical protein
MLILFGVQMHTSFSVGRLKRRRRKKRRYNKARQTTVINTTTFQYKNNMCSYKMQNVPTLKSNHEV